MKDKPENFASDSQSQKEKQVWVICCGMKRSGSTLQYQLAGSIVEKAKVGRLIGSVLPNEFAVLRAAHEGEKGLLIVKSHAYIPHLEALFAKGESKAIYSYRDVRDVVVSMMNKRNESFEQLVNRGFIETILSDYGKWRHCSPLLTSKYEDMVADLSREVSRIADFLNVPLDVKTIEEIAIEHSLEKQREKINNHQNENQRVSNNIRWDSQSLLHTNHIRSGKADQWRTELAAHEIAVIEGIAGVWLQKRGYSLSQPLLKRKVAATERLLTRVQKRLKIKK